MCFHLEETVLGLVTIGQAPRDDLMLHILPFLPNKLGIRQAGALDGLTNEQIARLAPDASDDMLHTRLRDGSAVVVGRERIASLVQARIDQLEGEGANIILLLCTAEFPALQSGVLLVEPDRLLVSLVRGLRPHRIGVFLPLASQVVAATEKWMAVEAEKVYVAALPCGESDVIVRAARELQESSVDLVVMDCVGYTEAHKRLVTKMTGKPVILAISLVAWLLGELVCSASLRSHFPVQGVELSQLE
jgi:protein AroM